MSIDYFLFVIVTTLIINVRGCRAVEGQISPPIWEYSYQYELFEKVLQETSDLKKGLERINDKLFGGQEVETPCPLFWVPGNGSCYHVQLGYQATWPEARSSCESINSNLAVIETEEENNLIQGIVSASGLAEDLAPLWIGGIMDKRERVWHWVGDVPITQTDWIQDTGGKEKGHQCLSWSMDGWFKESCKGKTHKFICENDRDD